MWLTPFLAISMSLSKSPRSFASADDLSIPVNYDVIEVAQDRVNQAETIRSGNLTLDDGVGAGLINAVDGLLGVGRRRSLVPDHLKSEPSFELVTQMVEW